MQNLYLRSEKGSELTWEELDTNWTRIKNGVEAVEQALEDTRTNKEWILPLYLLGNADAEERAWLGVLNYEDNQLCGIHYRNSDVLTVIGMSEQYRGILHQSDNRNLSIVSVGAGSLFDMGITIQDNSPYANAGISMSSSTIGLFIDDTLSMMIANYDGLLHLGFFGEHAQQQVITEISSEPAITELQDILIAYGLAVDNRIS
jgi:hypothetical protein